MTSSQNNGAPTRLYYYNRLSGRWLKLKLRYFLHCCSLDYCKYVCAIRSRWKLVIIIVGTTSPAIAANFRLVAALLLIEHRRLSPWQGCSLNTLHFFNEVYSDWER